MSIVRTCDRCKGIVDNSMVLFRVERFDANYAPLEFTDYCEVCVPNNVRAVVPRPGKLIVDYKEHA